MLTRKALTTGALEETVVPLDLVAVLPGPVITVPAACSLVSPEAAVPLVGAVVVPSAEAVPPLVEPAHAHEAAAAAPLSSHLKSTLEPGGHVSSQSLR